jgi:hypothetical protein
MIAEELPLALRVTEQAAKYDKCIREPDFHALYRQLGNEKTMNEIREANPDIQHCRFLEQDCLACDQFPMEIGTARRGAPCPNNPYFGEHADVLCKAEERSALVTEANYWADLSELAMAGDPRSLDPMEFLMLKIARNYRADRDRRMQLEQLEETEDGSDRT